jgi:hypothetical protein
MTPAARASPWRRLRVAALGTATAGFLLATALHLLNQYAYGRRYEALDSGHESSWTHVAGSIALGCAAVVTVWTAVPRRRRPWAPGACMFAFLFVDNVTRLHSHIPQWRVVYAPLLVGLCAWLLAVARATALRSLMAVGVGLLAASLLVDTAKHGAVSILGLQSDALTYQVAVAVKEAAEFAGWLVVIPTVLALALDEPLRTRGAAPGTARARAPQGPAADRRA